MFSSICSCFKSSLFPATTVSSGLGFESSVSGGAGGTSGGFGKVAVEVSRSSKLVSALVVVFSVTSGLVVGVAGSVFTGVFG